MNMSYPGDPQFRKLLASVGNAFELSMIILTIRALDEKYLKLYPQFISKTKVARLAYIAMCMEEVVVCGLSQKIHSYDSGLS